MTSRIALDNRNYSDGKMTFRGATDYAEGNSLELLMLLFHPPSLNFKFRAKASVPKLLNEACYDPYRRRWILSVVSQSIGFVCSTTYIVGLLCVPSQWRARAQLEKAMQK